MPQRGFCSHVGVEKTSLRGGKWVKRKSSQQENQLLCRLGNCKICTLTLYVFARISGSFGMYIFYLHSFYNAGLYSVHFLTLSAGKEKLNFFTEKAFSQRLIGHWRETKPNQTNCLNAPTEWLSYFFWCCFVFCFFLLLLS